MTLKASQKQTFYLLVLGNVVILALVGMFVLRPVFGLLSKHTHEISTVRAETASLTQKTAALKQLKETFPAYQAEYASAVATLPKTKDAAGYQTTLEDLAKLTSINLTLVDTTSGVDPQNKAKTAGGFPVVPVKMEVSGSFTQLLDFMTRLESMNRFTRVTGLAITADQAGAVRATISAQSLYFPN